ncbi:Ankyrin repeat domain-containing protein 29 [Blattella germanica]|nr:Ankyrin repeat domain-containing protein 29 [Blattella germanica]
MKTGTTALFFAAQGGFLDIAQILMDSGAPVDSSSVDRATPLFIASQNGHFKILLFLLAQGAYPDSKRTDGATPLWIAAQMGHDHIVRQLLKVGANVDSPRHDGATALFKASHKGHSSVIEELLKYKPSLGLLHVSNKNMDLMLCPIVVKQLIAAGADATLHNQEGATPLQLARENKQASIVEYLSSITTDRVNGVPHKAT